MGWLRQPRTTQERRKTPRRNKLVEDGYVVWLRPSRNMANLVEAWDDIPRPRYKSWKKYRRKQYSPRRE